ncbi:MAG: peptidoglycan DD-metalloendopeptidase family protein [Balneolaceae bacterium]
MHKTLFVFTFVISAIALLTFCERNDSSDENRFKPVSIHENREILPEPAEDKYGFLSGAYKIMNDEIRRNENLSLILQRHGVSPRQIYYIQQEASEFANLNRLKPGQKYKIYKSGNKTVGMVWHLNSLDYLVMRWSDDPEDIQVERDSYELKTVKRTAHGEIKRSLYESLSDEGLSTLLGSELADIFAWEIDFFTLRRGDQYKVIYEELYVEDRFYGIGRVHAAEFNHRGVAHKAFYYNDGDRTGYFDEDGNSLQKALLKAPFRYNQRISSGFSQNRYHPILKERRPHYGIDYAAPAGTPIIAVGDGEIIEARRRGGNGNIIRIKHNSVYKTAYLHLNGFASGIRAGVKVEQGQVIGYVGQTGLATGPHLCYRLYVGDNPVNSLTVDLPASESLSEEDMAEFRDLRHELERQLDRMTTDDSIVQSVTLNSPVKEIYQRTDIGSIGMDFN